MAKVGIAYSCGRCHRRSVRGLLALTVALAAAVAMVAVVTGSPSEPVALQQPSATPTTVASAPAGPVSAAPTRSPIPLDQLRVSLPRLGIDLPLALGDVQRDVRLGATPEHVALLFPTTRVPGTGGNSYIYAHARDDMFLRLWDVRIGDQVRITGPGGVHFDYAITRIVPRVDPADTSWLDPTGPERLTLQTSTGPTGSEPRFIAVAERIAQVGD